MNKNKIALSSLALDLRRVAIGYQRGSDKMAERFFEEAIKRKNEIDIIRIKPYLRKLLEDFIKIKYEKEISKKAEDALMYSILFQNASIVK